MGKFIYYFMEIIEKNILISNNNNFDEKSRSYAEIKSFTNFSNFFIKNVKF